VSDHGLVYLHWLHVHLWFFDYQGIDLSITHIHSMQLTYNDSIIQTFKLVWVFFQLNKSPSTIFAFERSHLLYMLMFLLMIDAIILGVWSGIDTLEATIIRDDNSLIEYWVLCRSDHLVAFIAVIAIYKVLSTV